MAQLRAHAMVFVTNSLADLIQYQIWRTGWCRLNYLQCHESWPLDCFVGAQYMLYMVGRAGWRRVLV